MMPFFDIGDVVRVAAIFVNSAGSAIDPTVVKFSYQVAAIGTSSTFTYSVSGITKTATGNYYADIDTTTSSGQYAWRFFSTGTGQAAEQGMFYVKPSAI